MRTKLLAFLLLITPVSLLATNRYVDQGCSNAISTYVVATRACTGGSALSYSTITNAAAVAVAGDTVFIRAGTYSSGLNCQTQVCNSGTDWTTGAITWKPYNSEAVTLNGGIGYYASGDGYIIWDGTNTMTLDMNKAGGANSSCFTLSTQTGQPVPHHIRIRDLVCRETDGDGINIYKSSTMEIIHVTFVDNGDVTDTLGTHGIYASDILWDGTSQAGLLVENSSFSNSACMGIQILDSTRNSSHVIIRNNTFTAMPVNPNFGSGGVYLGGQNNFGPLGALIYNNLIYSPAAAPSNPIWPIAISTADQCKIVNNSIYMGGSAGHHGININLAGYYVAVGNVIQNNLIFNTGGQRYTNNGSGTICSTNNFNCSGGAQLYDPLFISTTDLQVQVGSSAIGSGTTQTDFTTDYAGVTRTVPWDAGAYEKVSGTSLTLLTPNGGESFAKNSSITVTWSSIGTPGNVDIDYGTDGVTFGTNLVNSTANDGSQAVTLPNSASATAYIRVSDDSTGLVKDQSNAPFAVTAAAGGSTTVIISDNTTGVKIGDIAGTSDGLLSQYFPNDYFGTRTDFAIQKPGSSSHQVTILKFDGLSSIPINATVSSVTLGIYLQSATVATAKTIDVFRLLRNSSESQQTWTQYSSGNPWTTAGARGSGTDRAASTSAQITGVTNTTGYYTVTDSSGTLLDDTQKIINGTYVNYGWDLDENGSGGDGVNRSFASSEGTNGRRPYLELTYSTSTSTITVNSPSGDHFFPNQIVPIRWETQGISGDVVITLSRDGGNTYDETLSSGIAYDAADFAWTIAEGRVYSGCFVKICSGATCGISQAFRIGGLSMGLTP